ncbi:BatA domain-containing protein [Spirosoma montaniterrae]|uniref:Aerotolerance regulator N-terminal domain-containing protein n=1 Tax=Spirosoma montaniterrae TaxID=1178516 RepID=A0A1P9WWN3_9BACT|nr:BatA domain-containing protein [Spirosoma montaniterrae]AQG79795.1 hypothetical protein AWR27_10940 [Spirosoma montaniterrae]
MFIEPAFLWASLAVVIPIAIHFWHQKRGKPLPWAAMRWLAEREQQQSRGLRLDNLWLLLLRCLLLIVLAIMLAQPLLNWLNQRKTVEQIHLVQPNAAVLNAFRFELEQARQQNERVVDTESFTNPLALQTAINALPTTDAQLHLYLVNDPIWADAPAITVPKRFQLHTVVDSAPQPKAYLIGQASKRLFVAHNGQLMSQTGPNQGIRFQTQPAHTGPIRVLLNYIKAAEHQSVRAALQALTDVYGFDFATDDKPQPNVSYDLMLTDHLPVSANPQTLYIVSDIVASPTTDNVIVTNETLIPQTSERVAAGQLPEWLGEQILRHYGVWQNRQPLSQRALKTLFVPTTKPEPARQAGLQHALTLFFIVVLILERWLALTKNA